MPGTLFTRCVHERITFRIELPDHNEIHEQSAEITINGSSLQTTILERAHATLSARDADSLERSIGILPSLAFPPSTYWLGEPIHGNKLTVLRCGGCGIPDCWSITAQIDIDDAHVTWHHFEWGHYERKGLERPIITDQQGIPLVFTFEKQHYLDALVQQQQILELPFTTSVYLSKDPE